VAQVYVGACPGDTTAAPRQLAGFAKVRLDPGASQRVQIDLALEPLSSWSPATQAWTTPACARGVWVGGSSRDLPLTDTQPPPPVAQVAASTGSGGCASTGGTGALGLLALAPWALRRRRPPSGGCG
jgi:Synergist-CTERM protein sorting domain-containing protein